MINELLYIDESVRDLGIYVVYSIVWFNAKPDNDLERDIKELENWLRENYSIDELKDNPIVRAYRDFYWRIGIDPTKTRPSGEALVRRVLRGKRFPRINPVVDAGNIASAYTFVPIGLYDLAKTKPPLTLRLSHGGELFKPIGGSDEVLEPNIPILVDQEGRVLHIYPHRDSRETCITPDTREVLIMGAGVPNVDRGYVVKAVEKVIELLKNVDVKSCNKCIIKP